MIDVSRRVVSALQPVRNYFLAQALWFALESSLLETLHSSQRMTVAQISEATGWAPYRVQGLLNFLRTESVVVGPAADDTYSLTPFGSDVLFARPWYELLMGGYDKTLQPLPSLMADRNTLSTRDGAWVGKGSCGISQYDAIPVVSHLIAETGDVGVLVDMGCGDGSFLIGLCEEFGLPGIGFDPHASGMEAANAAAAEKGIADRVHFEVGGIEDVDRLLPANCDRPFFIAAFTLQELLEQQGRDAVVQAVSLALARPSAHLGVVEVDNQSANPKAMSDDFAKAYYNPYFLIHVLTEQRLLPLAQWRDLFADAGATILDECTTAREIDPTGFMVGFLLRSAHA